MKPKIYLAPMAGTTDLSFRLISRRFGAAHCFLEMLDSMAAVRDNPKNLRLMKTIAMDRPISAQLLGEDPAVMLEAAGKVMDRVRISTLDVNSACPARKVLAKGAGAALLKNAPKLGRIIQKLSSELRIPVTVKLRTGFYERDVAGCVKTALVCQENGASAVFIHGRTVSQGYSGDVDYESIRAVKKALKIPVFGSGNVFTPELAKKMLDETSSDGILVARGALGNPWIFEDIENYLKTGKLPKGPTLDMKKKVLKKHLAYIEKYKEIGPRNKIGYMGRVTMTYFRGILKASRFREEICKAKSYAELIRVIDSVEQGQHIP